MAHPWYSCHLRTLIPRLCLLGRLTLLVVVLLAGCGDGSGGPRLTGTNDSDGERTYTLPDGMVLSIPAGGAFVYGHAQLNAGGTGFGSFFSTRSDNNQESLVIARIDWSACSPNALSVQFAGNTYTGPVWRIPTLVTSPLAGINVLGVFSGGGTLEGGIGMPMHIPGFPGTPGVDHFVVTGGCEGDWVTVYGYSFP